MPIKNQFKPLPELDLPFLNDWRDRIIEKAHSIERAHNVVIITGPRETIDFEKTFNTIKQYSLLEREEINTANVSAIHNSVFTKTLTKITQIIGGLK